jgi:hypothetical protein
MQQSGFNFIAGFLAHTNTGQGAAALMTCRAYRAFATNNVIG